MNTLWKRMWDPFIPAAKMLQPLRTTFVVKRVNEAPLRKSQKFPSLRRKHFVYETIEDNTSKAEYSKVLLTKYVADIGQPGEIVTLKSNKSRLLLLQQSAAYPTPENIAKYGGAQTAKADAFSSRFAKTTLQSLSKFVLNISMNKENPWTMEPWHIRAAFRRAHVIIPESAIQMPEHPISGPDMNNEGKEFYITVTINKIEKTLVRCRIHHYSTNIEERLAPVRDHWRFPAQLLFPEDKEISKQLPEMIPPVLEEDLQMDFRKIRRAPKKLADVLR